MAQNAQAKPMDIMEFNYESIIGYHQAKKLPTDAQYIQHNGVMYLSELDSKGTVDIIEGPHAGDKAKKDFLTTPGVYVHDFGDDTEVPLAYKVYPFKSVLHILYKDIEYISSYFGKPETWLKNNGKAITTYFYSKIDDEVSASINAIDIKPKTILDTIDKYNLPKTRDLMLMKAMEKYSSEMATLLSSIQDADLKKSFGEVIKSMNGLFKKK